MTVTQTSLLTSTADEPAGFRVTVQDAADTFDYELRVREQRDLALDQPHDKAENTGVVAIVDAVKNGRPVDVEGVPEEVQDEMDRFGHEVLG